MLSVAEACLAPSARHFEEVLYGASCFRFGFLALLAGNAFRGL
jgi:hypothetical protein